MAGVFGWETENHGGTGQYPLGSRELSCVLRNFTQLKNIHFLLWADFYWLNQLIEDNTAARPTQEKQQPEHGPGGPEGNSPAQHVPLQEPHLRVRSARPLHVLCALRREKSFPAVLWFPYFKGYPGPWSVSSINCCDVKMPNIIVNQHKILWFGKIHCMQMQNWDLAQIDIQ